jgi:hypothetical protein
MEQSEKEDVAWQSDVFFYAHSWEILSASSLNRRKK